MDPLGTPPHLNRAIMSADLATPGGILSGGSDALLKEPSGRGILMAMKERIAASAAEAKARHYEALLAVAREEWPEVAWTVEINTTGMQWNTLRWETRDRPMLSDAFALIPGLTAEALRRIIPMHRTELAERRSAAEGGRFAWALAQAREEWPEARWKGKEFHFDSYFGLACIMDATASHKKWRYAWRLYEGSDAKDVSTIVALARALYGESQHRDDCDAIKAKVHYERVFGYENSAGAWGGFAIAEPYSLSKAPTLAGVRNLAKDVLGGLVYPLAAAPAVTVGRWEPGQDLAHAFSLPPGESRHGRRAGLA